MQKCNEAKTPRSSDEGSVRYTKYSTVGSGDTFEFSFPDIQPSGLDSPTELYMPHHDRHFSSPGAARDSTYDIKESSSLLSPDSVLNSYGHTGYPPVDSPQKPKAKQGTDNASPEILHLVDSSIMGKAESLEKLKNVVSAVESFGEDDDTVDMAYIIVDSLLATMGGVESFEAGKDNPPSVMLNSRAAIVAGELTPWLPDIGDFESFMSPRTRMVRGLLAILCACTRNREMCSVAGLLGVLLRTAERIFVEDIDSKENFTWDGTPLCYCIQFLAGHSLSPHDLHLWLKIINKTLTTEWGARLLHSLENSMGGNKVSGPSITFEFDGESSGLLGPGESRWPFANGYAFATWIYIESFADNICTAKTAAAIAMAAAATSVRSSPREAAVAASALAGEATTHMPHLFSFLSAENQGMEAYFHGQFLVVECVCGNGRKSSLHFTHAFKPQCWYFIGLEHTCKQGLLGKSESELRLYIDGSLYESRPFDFPKISEPLDFFCIGTNPPPTMSELQRHRRQCPLFAEMGPVYIYKDPIGPEKMSQLAKRGGDVLPSLDSGVESPWLATNENFRSMPQESALMDTEIAGHLHLLYHPSLLSGRYCPDASPSGAAGILRRSAEVIGQVHVSTRMRPAEALWALAHGGNVHENNLEPRKTNLCLSLLPTSLAAPIFRIILLAICHPGNSEELLRRRGTDILSQILNYLLQTLSLLDSAKRDGDEELVAAIISLCQSQELNHTLKVQLFCTLLFDLKIWSIYSYGLQKKFWSSLADMVYSESMVMRDANAIQALLDGCRLCYWTVRENDSVDTFYTSENGRPVGEINALVDELLVVVELLILAAPLSLASDDVRCLLGFMVDCPQPNQVSRVLHLIYRLVVQPKFSRAQTFAQAFMSCGGIETLLVLLQRETKAGDHEVPELLTEGASAEKFLERKVLNLNLYENASEPENFSHSTIYNVEEMSSLTENRSPKNLGGISYPINAENARNNVDKNDGIILAIINLLIALLISGHLKVGAPAPGEMTNNLLGLLEVGGTMFDDKVYLLLFTLCCSSLPSSVVSGGSAKIKSKSAKSQSKSTHPRKVSGPKSSNHNRGSPLPTSQANNSMAPRPVQDGGGYDDKLAEMINSMIIDQSPSVKWEDIAGLEMAKQTLLEMAILPTKRRDLFTGLRKPAKGLLLFGPPGTGKTLLAKAVASESDATFFSVSASSLTSKWVGEGEKLVRTLFQVAISRQPSVIFIDEIDSIMSTRKENDSEASVRRLKAEFLVQFDGVSSSRGDLITVIGATNKPQELDDAVLRRLVKKIYIPLPDKNTRRLLFKHKLKGSAFSLPGRDLERLVADTDGYSGSDLQALCGEAAMMPIRELGSNILTVRANRVRGLRYSDFEKAMTVIRPSLHKRKWEELEKWNREFGAN